MLYQEWNGNTPSIKFPSYRTWYSALIMLGVYLRKCKADSGSWVQTMFCKSGYLSIPLQNTLKLFITHDICDLGIAYKITLIKNLFGDSNEHVGLAQSQ